MAVFLLIFLDIFNYFPHAKNISSNIKFALIEMLRSRITFGRACRVGVGIGIAKSQVNDFYIIIDLCEHNVLRFEVAIYYMIFVQAFKRIQ